MAVDGKKFRETLRQGSDDWHEFPCSPCAKENRNVAAVKYCVECDENLCSACLTHHNRFSMMRGHQISDNLQNQFGQGRPDLPTQRCDRHGGKLVDLYCPHHDSVGCAACIAIDHSSCQGIRYIPEIQVSEVNRKIDELEIQLEARFLKLCQQKKGREDNLSKLHNEKGRLFNEIKEVRQQLIQKLDTMVNRMKSVVDSTIGKKAQDVTMDIAKIDKIKQSLEQRRHGLKEAKHANDAEKFVQLKLASTCLEKEDRNSDQPFKGDKVGTWKLVLNDDIRRQIDDKNVELGRLTEIRVPEAVVHETNFNVRLPSEGNVCNIFGMCLTTSGELIFTDYNNKCLKKLETGNCFKIQNSRILPDNPFGVCEVDNTRLAVTLINFKKVQLISQQSLELKESFAVGDRCRAIACYEGQIYVCCGGSEKRQEGPGHIEVLNFKGDLLRTYYGEISCPVNIHANNDCLLITDAVADELFIYNMRECRMSSMRVTNMSGLQGMCRMGDSQWCCIGADSENIVLISQDGEFLRELLTEKEGIIDPLAVCFEGSKLFVTCVKSDIIKVFRVVY